jgi:hypothetical protein
MYNIRAPWHVLYFQKILSCVLFTLLAVVSHNFFSKRDCKELKINSPHNEERIVQAYPRKVPHISGSKQWHTFKRIAYWQCRTNVRCIITVRTVAEETASVHSHTTHNTKRTQSQSDIDKHPKISCVLVSTDVRVSTYVSGLSHNQAVHWVFQRLWNNFNVRNTYPAVRTVKQSRQI